MKLQKNLHFNAICLSLVVFGFFNSVFNVNEFENKLMDLKRSCEFENKLMNLEKIMKFFREN